MTMDHKATDDLLEELQMLRARLARREEAAPGKDQEALEQKCLQLQHTLDLVEQDRKLLAFEIHDGIMQQMTGALMQLEACKASLESEPDRTTECIQKSLQLLREAITEARRLIGGLRPPLLDELGLVAAIEALVDQSKSSTVEVDFVHDVKFERLATSNENSIFRIVQEALNNACRHSNSEKVLIDMQEQKSHLRIEIRDWGKGFDPEKVSVERFGLQGIRQRALLLGGSTLIESSPGKGTRIVVELPLT